MENEPKSQFIDAHELSHMLGMTRQNLHKVKWLPPFLKYGKNKTRLFDRKDVMDAIDEKNGIDANRKRVIEPNRFYDAMKDLVENHDKISSRGNANQSYKKYKIVQNKGDIMLACRLKQDASRPWIYERRRDTLIDKAAIK